MPPGAWWSLLSRPRSSSSYRVTWTDEIFKKSDDAEASLCEHRAAFVLRHDIMALIPTGITKYMIHSGVILSRSPDEGGPNISVPGVAVSQNNSPLSDGVDAVYAASTSGHAGRTSDGVTGSVRLRDTANIDVGKGALIHTPFARFLCLTAFVDYEHSTLTLLPYVDAASWSPSLVCHHETRKDILHDIMSFLTARA